MCWDMTFPEDWLCSMTVMAPNVVGATCLTKFRPIAGLCAIRIVLGYQVTPSNEIRERTNCVCAEDACRCWTVSAVASGRVAERVAEEIVVVQLDVKKAFDHVDHRAAFKAVKLQGVSLFSMALIAAIWNGSCMKRAWGRFRRTKFGCAEDSPTKRRSLQSSSQ